MRSALEKTLKTTLPYVADAGTVAYVATAVFALVVVVAEFLSPGLVSSVVAPQMLILCLLATGSLALVDVQDRKRSRARQAAFAALGAIASAFAFWTAWYYFSPVPDVQARLAALAGLVVALAFAAAASPAPEDL